MSDPTVTEFKRAIDLAVHKEDNDLAMQLAHDLTVYRREYELKEETK